MWHMQYVVVNTAWLYDGHVHWMLVCTAMHSVGDSDRARYITVQSGSDASVKCSGCTGCIGCTGCTGILRRWHISGVYQKESLIWVGVRYRQRHVSFTLYHLIYSSTHAPYPFSRDCKVCLLMITMNQARSHRPDLCRVLQSSVKSCVWCWPLFLLRTLRYPYLIVRRQIWVKRAAQAVTIGGEHCKLGGMAKPDAWQVRVWTIVPSCMFLCAIVYVSVRVWKHAPRGNHRKKGV